MRISKTKLVAIVAITAIANFLIGGGFMYLIDSTWIDNQVAAHKDRLDNRMIRYIEAVEVSNQMTDNCYDAFYTVSECSTKDGCDFESTIDSLTELNIKRKILREKLDLLLDDTEVTWSKIQPL
jgi:hypothetical protein